jgi:hypothetical protein
MTEHQRKPRSPSLIEWLDTPLQKRADAHEWFPVRQRSIFEVSRKPSSVRAANSGFVAKSSRPLDDSDESAALKANFESWAARATASVSSTAGNYP